MAILGLKNIIKYTFYGLLSLLLAVVTTLLLLFNSPKIQTYITSQITDYLSAQFKTKITIDHIKYYPFSGFALDNVYWGDQKNDTLFFVDELRFNFGGFNQKSFKLTLNDVIVEGGYCKIITYPDSVFNIDVLFNIEDPNDTIPDTLSPPFKLYFNRVACHNSRFRLIDSTEAFEPIGFDGFNEDFHSVELLAKDFWIIEDSLHFDLKKLSTTERSGFRVEQISGISTICGTGMLFDNLKVHTPYSYLTNRFHMTYQNWHELADFNQVVILDGHLENSKVDIRDIAFFAPYFIGSKQAFTVNGNGNGTVSNLKLNQIDIRFGVASLFKGNGSIRGLPTIDETFLDIKAKESQTNKLDLERLISMDLPTEITRLGNMTFNGRYTGFLHDFVAYGNFKTALGVGISDMNMKLGDSLNADAYSGRLELIDFDLGALFQQPLIGKTSLTTVVDGKGFSFDELATSFQTNIQYLQANHYSYKHIDASGHINKKMFTGILTVNDPNAELTFNGIVDLNQTIPLYQFKANIAYADFRALHIDTSNIVLSTDIDINLAIKNTDQNSGTIDIANTLFIKNGIDYPIERIQLVSENTSEQKKLSLTSDFLEAEMIGLFSFEHLPEVFLHIRSSLFPEYFRDIPSPHSKAQNFTYKASLSDSKLLSDLFFPHINIQEANIKGIINEPADVASLNLSIGMMTYNSMLLQNIRGSANVKAKGKGSVEIDIEKWLSKDTVLFHSLSVNSKIEHNTATTQIVTNDTHALVYGNVNIETTFEPNQITAHFNRSDFAYKNKIFRLSEQNHIVWNEITKDITIDSFALSHRNEQITIDGFYNANSKYNLVIKLDELELSLVNLIYPPLNYQTSGTTNGKIVFKSDVDNFWVNSFLRVNNLALDYDTIGDFTFTSNYDEVQKRIIGQAKSTSGKLRDLTIGGFIDMNKSPYWVNADLHFSESDLKSFQAFIKNDVTIFYGKASAKGKITGPLNNLVLDGNISLNQVLARVEYLKATYGFNAKVNFDKNTIAIVPFKLKDVNGNQANISGSISHKSFQQFRFDLNLNDLKSFQVLNTTSKDNSLFYGTAYATGSMSLKGPMEDLILEANLKSDKGTVLSIPLSDSEDNDGNDLLNFVDKDTTIRSSAMQKQSALLGLGMNMHVTITPDAEIQLVFDEIQNDKIVGTGKGLLQMNLTKQGVFSMYGQVAIEEGVYTFTAVDVITRKFLLQQGGTITWAGDPLQARINVQGIYKVRSTTLANLLPGFSEQQATANEQRVPVECILNLKGNLLSPEIGFDLNLPDRSTLAGNNASGLENTLRRLRNEPDLMQQQVVSLLLFGQFVPLNQTQANTQSNFSAGLNNTLSDLISAQATNILADIIPGISVSAEYQSNNQQAILSASKKFFNNRFELQTSVSVLEPNTNKAVIGQYNLSADGNIKLRGFNRTAPNPIYRQNITSSGIGLYYRKEFDSFNELLKKKNKQYVVPNN